MVEIRLNGQNLELEDDDSISYTLQVNDIGDVQTRQASYTNSFKLPKTPNNTEMLQGLGLVGDTSRVPYRKVSCELLEDGYNVIRKGWAQIKNTDDYYILNIYNGIIDFFKAIENKTLGIDLDLSEINHLKNVQNVVDSFTANLPYSYLVADYNGKTHYDVDNKINIDYLSPSAKVSYLWNKIFDTFGFTYSGSVFSNPKFTNLWITYPKGIDTTTPTPPTKIYDVTLGGFIVPTPNIYFNGNTFTSLVNQTIGIKLATSSNDPFVGYIIRLYINGILATPAGFINLGGINYIPIYQLNANDTFYSTYQPTNNFGATGPEIITPNGVVEIYNNGTPISFSDELKDFKITDFIKEILNHFGLTMFTNEHTNEIVFMTIKERVDAVDFVDWSDKYHERTTENYIFDNYAQRNNFVYQYDDKQGSYNDSFIPIDNKNIKDSVDVLKSFTYSPLNEVNSTFLIGTVLHSTKIFKQYNKEVKENSTGIIDTKYKPLTKRYYFQRAQQITGTATFGSETTSNYQSYTGIIQLANYDELDMQSVIRNNYNALQTILNDSRLHTIKLALSLFDVINLDFKKLYFFEQEQQYYFLNKLNYKTKELSAAEFVRVKRKIDTIYVPDTTFINLQSVTFNNCQATATFTTDAPIGSIVQLICEPNQSSNPIPTNPDPIYVVYVNHTVVAGTNTIVFNTNIGAYYSVKIASSTPTTTIYSNNLFFNNTANCILVSPNNVTITSVTLLSSNGLTNLYKVDFTTDATLPKTIYSRNYKTPIGLFGGWSSYVDSGVANTNSINIEISTIFGVPEKTQIRIGLTQSNEYNL